MLKFSAWRSFYAEILLIGSASDHLKINSPNADFLLEGSPIQFFGPQKAYIMLKVWFIAFSLLQRPNGQNVKKSPSERYIRLRTYLKSIDQLPILCQTQRPTFEIVGFS